MLLSKLRMSWEGSVWNTCNYHVPITTRCFGIRVISAFNQLLSYGLEAFWARLVQKWTCTEVKKNFYYLKLLWFPKLNIDKCLLSYYGTRFDVFKMYSSSWKFIFCPQISILFKRQFESGQKWANKILKNGSRKFQT